MKKTKISSKFVKMHFLLADAMRDTCRLHKILGTNELQQTYDRYQYALLEAQESQLDTEIGKKDKKRLQRYNERDWYEQEIFLGNIGNYPKLKGLDIRLTTGDVFENAKSIRLELAGVNTYGLPNEFITQIHDMQPIYSWIQKRFPLILFPEDTIRGEKNDWARKVNKPDYWLCKKTQYDLEAGNSRSIRYALNGSTHARCLVAEK